MLPYSALKSPLRNVAILIPPPTVMPMTVPQAEPAIPISGKAEFAENQRVIHNEIDDLRDKRRIHRKHGPVNAHKKLHSRPDEYHGYVAEEHNAKINDLQLDNFRLVAE